MSTAVREFTLKNVFKDVSKIKEGDSQDSEGKEYFNVPWKTRIVHEKEYLDLFLYCEKPRKSTQKWSIETELTLKLSSVNGKSATETLQEIKYGSDSKFEAWGFRQFMKWEEMEKKFLVDDKLVIEVHVKINKMNGIEKKKLRNFNKSMEIFSDVVLIAEKEKFYVSRVFLATHSTFFKTLLLGKSDKSKESQVKINVKSKDFQRFLELIYGDDVIDDENIDGIIEISELYKSKTAMNQCENFLINESKKDSKEKLEIALKHDFELLKVHCLINIKNVADVRKILPGNPDDWDSSITKILLQKCIQF